MTDPRLRTAAEGPRDVANKSDKDRLRRALRMTLEIESPAVRRNTQTFKFTWLELNKPSGVNPPALGGHILAQIPDNRRELLLRKVPARIEAVSDIQVARLRSIDDKAWRVSSHIRA